MTQSAFAARKAAQSRAQWDDLDGSPTQIRHTNHPDDFGDQPQQQESRPRKRRRRIEKGTIVVPDELSANIDQDAGAGDKKSISVFKQVATSRTKSHARKDQTSPDVEVDDRPIPDPAQSDTLAVEPSQPAFNREEVWDATYKTVDINIQPGDSVSVVGEYDLWIKKGSIRILGATMHASSRSFRVQCPTTHSISPIEALSNPFGPASQAIDICLSSCSSGLRRLRQCDPRFQGIWQRRECNAASFEIVIRVSF